MCVSLCGCVPMSAGTCGARAEVSDPLELELWELLSWLVWVLGIKYRSSAPNHSAISVSLILNS